MCAFEVIEHTADVGLHLHTTSLDDLFAEAARGATALIVENPDDIRPQSEVTFELAAENIEGLFVDWLRELIYLFETQGWLFREFTVRTEPTRYRLSATCRGEPADWARHLPDNELKAVTYHALRVAPVATGWEADVIFDI